MLSHFFRRKIEIKADAIRFSEFKLDHLLAHFPVKKVGHISTRIMTGCTDEQEISSISQAATNSTRNGKNMRSIYENNKSLRKVLKCMNPFSTGCTRLLKHSGSTH